MSDHKTQCGPHREILKTDGVRITQCTCGTVHVTMVRNGTTLQLAPEYFSEIAQAFGLARTVLSSHDSTQPATSANAGRFITIQPFNPKKDPN